MQLLGNCSIKRVWCISHCASVCTEAWGIKTNSSPPFPHPMLHAQCHWACLSLLTPSLRESLREERENAWSAFNPYSLLKLLYLQLYSSFKGLGKALPAQEDPCHQQNLQQVPILQRHGVLAYSVLCLGRASLSGEGVHAAWKKIRSRSVRSHLCCRNEKMEKGGE